MSGLKEFNSNIFVEEKFINVKKFMRRKKDTYVNIISFHREKPHDTEWLDLIKIKIPLLLNYSQCKLINKDYYAVIEHCTEVLKHEPSK